MARSLNKLNALKVERLKAPGLYGDGNNLYLQVTDTGSKSWIWRYNFKGRSRAMGLGPLDLVPLSKARELAIDNRRLLKISAIDPLEAKREKAATALAEAARSITFDECSDRYITAHEGSWRNSKHRQQWRNTLATYAAPVLGPLPVSMIEATHVLKVLEPIWYSRPETASRLRGRVERILEWAKGRGYRHGENPAQWKDGLRAQLPPRSKVRATKHHAAIPYAAIPAFAVDLRSRGGVSSKALEFTLLTACRTAEVIGARWTEIDLHAQIWTIPKERMKMGREHSVPLSEQALQALSSVPRDDSGYVFIGGRQGRPLSNMAMAELMKELRPGQTVHGLRSSFRDWTSEKTDHPREIAEAALAHAVADRVEAAYRRGQLLEKRRMLMRDWAEFVFSNL